MSRRLRGREVLTPARERDAPRVKPHPLDVGHGVAGIGQREDGVGRAELRVREIRRGLHRLNHRNAAGGFVGNELAQLLGRGDHGRAVAAICADAMTKCTLCG